MPLIDTATDFGKRLQERLRSEQIIWLVTVDKEGPPQPSPVWFHWHDDEIMIFSQPNAPKIRNITGNPSVALHLNSSADGGDIAILTGTAEVVDGPRAHELEEYVTKYREGFKSLGMTPEEMVATYSATLRVTIRNVRGW